MTKVVLAAVAALAFLVSAAGAAPRADPGVTATQILLGGSAPFSGEASAAGGVARGAEAYFKWVNAHGGVHGRRITYKVLDDGYQPSRAVQNALQLVQQDGIFAMFNTIGTSNNLAMRPFLNQRGVPQFFAATGATAFGTDYRRYPWTIGYIPSYVAEGKIYGQYISRTIGASARVGVLYQSDDYGEEMLEGLRKGLTRGRIVKTVGYDPTATDVRSQIAELRSSGANVLGLFAFGKFAIQSYFSIQALGWKPRIFVNAVASASSIMKLLPQSLAQGSISIGFGKDPASPQWNRDAGIRLYRQVMTRYYRDGLRNSYAAAGAAAAFTMVDVLRKAGKNLTRAGALRAATRLTERNNPFLLPGIVVRTTPTSRFPIAQVRLQRWANGRWLIFGKLVAARP